MVLCAAKSLAVDGDMAIAVSSPELDGVVASTYGSVAVACGRDPFVRAARPLTRRHRAPPSARPFIARHLSQSPSPSSSPCHRNAASPPNPAPRAITSPPPPPSARPLRPRASRAMASCARPSSPSHRHHRLQSYLRPTRAARRFSRDISCTPIAHATAMSSTRPIIVQSVGVDCVRSVRTRPSSSSSYHRPRHTLLQSRHHLHHAQSRRHLHRRHRHRARRTRRHRHRQAQCRTSHHRRQCPPHRQCCHRLSRRPRLPRGRQRPL